MDNLEALKVDVFGRQKILAEIYRNSGNFSLLNYAETWGLSKPGAGDKFFSGHLQKHLALVYPEASAGEAAEQFFQSPLVSSIDHHGILNHPFFVNSNLIYSQRQRLGSLICFSTAGVSLNNSSWPGCLLVTGPDGRQKRFSFFSDKVKTQTVLAAKALGAEDVRRVKLQIQVADFLTENDKMRLLGLVEEVFRGEEFYKSGNFSRQASYVSSLLWAKVFPDAPKLFYVPLEEFVAMIIISEIATQKSHILHKLFFTARGWNIIERYFRNSLGAFSSSHKGSFLFWGIDGKGRRVRLARQKDHLEGDGFALSPDAEAMVNYLQGNKIYPTSLVCFLVLLHYGVTCLGGFNQVNWLTNIKEKFVDLLKEEGESDLALRVSLVPTKNFAEGDLAFGINRQGQVYKPTLLDLFLQDGPDLFKKYRRLASLITLEESINVQLPEIYKVITPSRDRDNGLSSVTESEILHYDGMTNKIKAVFGGSYV
jgi:hypothetical protein